MEVLLLIFIIAAFIQVFYFLFFFRRVAVFREPPISEVLLTPVSIVICARNDAGNLRKNLPSILEQDYPEFEVIVVNDHSEDDTELLLADFSKIFSTLVIRNVFQPSNIMEGKKYPLTVGIRAAKYDTVLLTDADCAVTGRQWIGNMASAFQLKKEIVLGYAPYKKRKGFLNLYIRFETFFTALQYLSYALAGLPYMGVGRNMAYRKKLFFEHNVYPKYPHLVSGDDDLFINAAANRVNTTICIRQSSFMYSDQKRTWEEYWYQKSRHVSTAKHYKLSHKLLLGLFSFTHFIFYVTFLLLIFYSSAYAEIILIFFIRLSIQGIIYFYSMKRLHEENLFFLFPVMDILFLLYYIKLFPAAVENQTAEWH